MVWIIVFLGIIAIAEVGSLVLNIINKTLQNAVNMVTEQLNREREQYSENRKQYEKELAAQKDATNLWAKKYFEMEILLKKAEHKEE